MNSYVVGTMTRLSVAFTIGGAPVDAGTLTLTMQAGAAAEPIDLTPSIVHDGAPGSGLYHVDYLVVDVTEPADPHKYTWRSSGSLNAVAGGRFMALALIP